MEGKTFHVPPLCMEMPCAGGNASQKILRRLPEQFILSQCFNSQPAPSAGTEPDKIVLERIAIENIQSAPQGFGCTSLPRDCRKADLLRRQAIFFKREMLY
jgi:hypothetical protein